MIKSLFHTLLVYAHFANLGLIYSPYCIMELGFYFVQFELFFYLITISINIPFLIQCHTSGFGCLSSGSPSDYIINNFAYSVLQKCHTDN
jgi:hypothetical protein